MVLFFVSSRDSSLSSITYCLTDGSENPFVLGKIRLYVTDGRGKNTQIIQKSLEIF
jgi:hypothetical protein